MFCYQREFRLPTETVKQQLLRDLLGSAQTRWLTHEHRRWRDNMPSIISDENLQEEWAKDEEFQKFCIEEPARLRKQKDGKKKAEAFEALPLTKKMQAYCDSLKKSLPFVIFVATYEETPSTKGQKMMMLIGKGGEGKSRIGLVLKAMLERCMNTGSIQKVESNRFARADLENRLLLVDDDMDLNALPKTNYIKSIVTAEMAMDVERKGIQSYQVQLYVRFLCFGNGALSSLYDHSDGFYRRQLILKTKDRPNNREDDPYLSEKLLQELDGIFLWALEGLRRLMANGYNFTVSERAKRNLDESIYESNTVNGFLESEGYIKIEPGFSCSTKELYEVYLNWCEDNAYPSMSKGSFVQQMGMQAEQYGMVGSNNLYENGKRLRGYAGVCRLA